GAVRLPRRSLRAESVARGDPATDGRQHRPDRLLAPGGEDRPGGAAAPDAPARAARDRRGRRVGRGGGAGPGGRGTRRGGVVRRRRGCCAAWPQAGVPLGLLASTGALGLADALLPEEAFLSWGWRVPFWLSGLLIVVGLVIRSRIAETPLFAQLKESQQVAHA